MPAPSNLDLKKEGLGEEKSSSHHRFLARFLDKKEMAKASCMDSSVSNKGPKNPSPTRQDSNSAYPKVKAAVIANPRSRVPGARSMPGEKSEVPLPKREHSRSPLVSLLKKNQVKGNEVNKLLVTVNVLGSAGPLRFLASCDDPVQKVMEMALKSYAREGRLPVLGQNIKQFELYCANSGCGKALDPSEIVGNLGIRNFLLCKKQRSKLQEEEEKHSSTSHQQHQKSNGWKNLLLTMTSSFGVAPR